MENISKAIEFLNNTISTPDHPRTLSFEDFIDVLSKEPSKVIRNVFQIFYDMMKRYIDEGVDEYPDDSESIHFVNYDCSRLFVHGADHPFFPDRPFANRLMKQVENFVRGAQQNKIYIFEGPPGCGKSTFLNNLLMKFEEYANTSDGLRFENIWKIDRKLFNSFLKSDEIHLDTHVFQQADAADKNTNNLFHNNHALFSTDNYIEVPCPSHDNPILMLPKQLRKEFFDILLDNNEFKMKLFTGKEYEWVFRDNPCTICSSIYKALLNKLKYPVKVYSMLYAQPYRFTRRLGEGISVFNPGDKPFKQNLIKNDILQNKINALFHDSNKVNYIYSRYAKTNNGVYALMDIKTHNTDRLIELHNIVSEGLHKVDDIEESVNSLLLALMNPEDKKNIEDLQSFSDRIEYIYIPYVLDINTEVEIYKNIFGKNIEHNFIPRVLHNFARVIISSRLNTRSDAMLEWISDPKKYSQFCDENLHLLKMELYTGYIPKWLSEEDRKKLTANRRRRIIGESVKEGDHGFSGRDSIKIFNDFYSSYLKEDRLINMANLHDFFTKSRKELAKSIPKGFLDSLLRMYNYTILQEVKESLYYYNEGQISKNIQNYMFAINFEAGSVEKCNYTGEQLEISTAYLENMELRLLGNDIDKNKRSIFREATQKEYTSTTLSKEIMLEGKSITATELYKTLHDYYVYHIKEKVLDPFLDNENFRRAIKDFDKDKFKTYDKKIKQDVKFLINNLCKKYNYTQLGAKEVCIYVIDNQLAKNLETS
jgi:predicted Ser/Thr protein kinase